MHMGVDLENNDNNTGTDMQVVFAGLSWRI